MTRPAPRLRSSGFDERVTMITSIVRGIVARSAPMHANGVARDPAHADAECRIAGLNVDYAGLRARAVVLGKPLPGVDPISLEAGVAQEHVAQDIAERWRAWALEFDPTLIDPAAEQHDAAVRNWMWW